MWRRVVWCPSSKLRLRRQSLSHSPSCEIQILHKRYTAVATLCLQWNWKTRQSPLCFLLCLSIECMKRLSESLHTAGSAISDVRGRIRLHSYLLLSRTPYLGWEISIYEPTSETIRTVEISRLSYCSLQHYIFIRWRLPSDVEVPLFFLVKFGMFHELEIRHLISFFSGILCIHVDGSWIYYATFVL